MKAHGIRETILLYQGRILDGRNRYNASLAAGVACQTREYVGDDPLGFVISLNLKRRHLSESQRAMVASKIAKLPKGSNQHTEFSAPSLSQAKAAELLNVSIDSVQFARKVDQHGVRELIDAVATGAVAVSAAAAIAKLSVDQQIEALALQDPKAFKRVVKQARCVDQDAKKRRRGEREKELAGKIVALPTRKYGAIVADPEWTFLPYSVETGMDRAAGNHYPTSSIEAIAARDVGSIAADDCVLFLWATAPMLPQALDVMRAWGFRYVSHAIWHKQRVGEARGPGYWFTGEHELVLVGVKGDVPAPAPGTQARSVIAAPVGEHSAKPQIVLEIIERLYPNVPKIELNRRGPARKGWDAWGSESAPPALALESR